MSDHLPITRQCNAAIVSTIAALPPETGGILGSADGIAVTDFVFDGGAESSSEFYVPDAAFLNREIARWRREDIRFFGMAHSHLRGRKKLSYSDIEYARRVMESMALEKLYMLLVDTDTVEYDVSVFAFSGENGRDFKQIGYTIV